MKRILFKGKEYVFGGDSLDESNFIATKEQYENGKCSYAHYYAGKGISRFGKKIGTRKDIKILNDVECNPKAGALHSLFTDKSWPLNI